MTTNKHTLRERLRGGGTLIGTFVAISHPIAVEISGSAGFDFVTIDAEHAQIDRGKIEEMVRAADAVGTQSIVRVPGVKDEWIAAALDAGASGVLVPRVSTAEQARAAVAATRYPPAGQRGVGPGRASLYGSRLPEYVAKANDSLLLAVQIETVEGVANAEEIAAVEGIDLLFIGPGDLSVSLAAHSTLGKAGLEVAITDVIEAGSRRGCPVGLFLPAPERLDEWLRRGLQLFIVSADSQFLQAGATATAAICREVLSRARGAAK
jgi:4-hydroxy-2-oxoheptanedioate aldolase